VANLDAMDLVGERRCHELSGRFLGARSALESFWKTLPARRGNCGSRSRRGRDGLLRVSRFLAVPGDSFPPPARTRGPEFESRRLTEDSYYHSLAPNQYPNASPRSSMPIAIQSRGSRP
jgi:hypothetical protein